ncbi:MAG: hypothetical protein KBE22_10215 [Candidatus Accumulibacter sp.]|uniref:Uncharacterized protein n=1 Tax=Candidatus Accumulibacter affinis TaxID=2954384 RepID=A0A935W8F2_9PROT|nr:hypothetical protein [Candidatus Accumulibacter affinis]MBP9805259.1 hypothetical protein [Accumulibacter sp.]
MAQAPLPFPVAEGAAIFIGVVAWDVLAAGEPELVKALLIAVIGALVWYGARGWLASNRRKRTP